MALELTTRANELSQNRVIEPNLILEIEGVTTLYSSIPVNKYIEYGDHYLYFGEDHTFGELSVDKEIKTFISSSGTSTTITQQLLQDKGAASSVTAFPIELVDKSEEITRLISPGFVIDEILAKRAIVYLNFKNGLHPVDSVIIHRGIIDDVQINAGSIKLNIASPEQLKRQSIFLKQSTETSTNALIGDTTIAVTSTENFIDPSTTMHTSYIRIEDEIIKWTSKSATQFLGCTRGQLGTIASAHASAATVDSFYRLQGNAIDMALNLMLSAGDEYFVTNSNAQHIGTIDGITLLSNSIFYNDGNIQEKYGLVSGDFITITGSTSNDVTLATIISFGKNENGSWIITDQIFTLEANTAGLVSFKSQYNVLNEGMGMTPQDVDVARHIDIQTRFSSGIAEYDFYIKDTLNGKDFISGEIYLPAGLYSLPRKTRASVGITLPPIADTNVAYLTSDNIINPSKLSSNRSTNVNFYNSVTIKYNELPLDEKFISGKITYSATSQNRFTAIGNKPFSVISKGLRQNGATDTLIRLNSRRWMDRYELGAELINKVAVLFKDGFKIDVGDTVVFGDDNIKMSDTSSGDRKRTPRLYEVKNKTLNIKTAEVTLDLLATNFAINGRYGIVSPSSYVDVGSTTTYIIIKDSFSTAYPKIEKDKWIDYIGQTIMIHSTDWTYNQETTIVSFSDTNNYQMNIFPALSLAPSANYIVDIPNYNNTTDPNINSLYKIIHCFFDPQLTIVTGISTTEFTLSSGDTAKTFIGSTIRIHNSNYTIDSGEILVSDIIGNTITTKTSIGFIPAAGHKVDLVGFKDEGFPYRLI